MDQLRTRIARKAKQVLRQAQMPPQPGAPAPATPPPAPGAAPAAPKPPTPPAAPMPPKPGVPGGTPPMGMPGKPKEEIEKDVEGDIRKRKEQEKRIEDLDEKVTTIGDQMEGLTKSINNLVNLMQKQTGGPTDFEKKFDDLKEKEEKGEDRSSTEFGMDKSDESLVRAKEGHLMPNAENLRKARENRITGAELEYHLNNPENKKYKQQVVPPPHTKLKDEPKDWDKYYNKLTASNLALDLNAAGTEWSVVDKNTDEVFFKLHPTAETADRFPSKEFAEEIIRDVKEKGLKAAMDLHKAEPFHSDIGLTRERGGTPPVGGDSTSKKPFSSDILKPKKSAPAGIGDKKPVLTKTPKSSPVDKGAPKPKSSPLSSKPHSSPFSSKKSSPISSSAAKTAADEPAKVTDEPTAEKAPEVVAAPAATPAPVTEPAAAPVTEPVVASQHDFERRFVRAFRLALSAQQKNIADNPLKAAWYEALASLDITDCEHLIESTFARSAAEHFEVTLAKTQEFLKLSDESFVEVEASIGELDTKIPVTASSNVISERRTHAAALRARASRGSLALSTETDTNDADEKVSRIASALPKPKLFGISKIQK